MTRVQVSSSQVTDNLWFAKGVNGEMSKHTSKQTGNIGIISKAKWEIIQKGKKLFQTQQCDQIHRQMTIAKLKLKMFTNM